MRYILRNTPQYWNKYRNFTGYCGLNVSKKVAVHIDNIEVSSFTVSSYQTNRNPTCKPAFGMCAYVSPIIATLPR